MAIFQAIWNGIKSVAALIVPVFDKAGPGGTSAACWA